VDAPASAYKSPKQGRPAGRNGQKPGSPRSRQPRSPDRSGGGEGRSFTDLANALGGKVGGERHKPAGARPAHKDGQPFRARRPKSGGKPKGARAASWA